MEESLKEKFDRAFYNLLDAGEKLDKVAEKLEYIGKLIKLNQAKQSQIKQILEVK